MIKYIEFISVAKSSSQSVSTMVSAFDSAVKTAKSPLVNWRPCCWTYTKVATPLLWLLSKWAHWMITELAKEKSLLLCTESYITKESTYEDTFWLEFTHKTNCFIFLPIQNSLYYFFPKPPCYQFSRYVPSRSLTIIHLNRCCRVWEDPKQLKHTKAYTNQDLYWRGSKNWQGTI